MFSTLVQKPIRTIFLLYAFLLLCGLGSFPLIDWDENIYGAVSKNMYLNQEYFRLTVNDQLYTEKPPFIFWITSLTYYCFGITEFSTRFQAVLSGLVSFFVLYTFGKRHFSEKMATYACLLYSSSLVPLFLSRTAYIDHWFNTFLFLSFTCVYEYHLKKEEPFKMRLPWLMGSSLFIGLGVLTKGPLGLFFPIASYFFLMSIQRKIQIFWFDLLIGFLLFCGVISVYYLPNLLIYGTDTIRGFYEFQSMLLNKSLESHTGPWFYHFLVAFVGFFPWTALLFFILKKSNLSLLLSKDSSHQGVFIFLGFWMISLLLIFSVVQTKLPHYSSSLYLGLSIFGARLLSLKEENSSILSISKLVRLTAIFGSLLGLFFFSLPYIFTYLTTTPEFQKQYGIYEPGVLGSWALVPGLFLLLGMMTSLFWQKKEQILGLLIHVWFVTQVFFVCLSIFLAPRLIPLLQDKNLRLYDFAKEAEGMVGFYKYLSFYPMFYRPEPILIMGNYKFRDDTELLSREKFSKLNKPLFLVTTRNKKFELPFLFPDRTFEVVKEDIDLILIYVK